MSNRFKHLRQAYRQQRTGGATGSAEARQPGWLGRAEATATAQGNGMVAAQTRLGASWLSWLAAGLLVAHGPLLNCCASPASARAPAAVMAGPTIQLAYAAGPSNANPVASFMYFVPLISPVPVSSVASPGSTQSAQVVSARRRFSASSFGVTCDFEFTGTGTQVSLMDLSQSIQRHERKLKAGGSLSWQLNSITVEGAGSGAVEVEGTVSNGVQTVTQVRLCFNAHGKTSPVSIGLCDIRYVDGAYQRCNEIVARVNSLTFRRQPGTPKMEVTVASVSPKGAGKSVWQDLKGGFASLAANLLVGPLKIEPAGCQAMLDFGQALVSGSPTFTFPLAKNLNK